MKTSLEVLKSRKYLRLDRDELNDCYIIEFRLSEGKGTAPIRIPTELLEPVIETLENGPSVVEEKNIVDVVRNSLAYDLDENDEEVVIFRTRYGRGSKIHKIRKTEYLDIISALKEINNDIPEVIAHYEDLSR